MAGRHGTMEFNYMMKLQAIVVCPSCRTAEWRLYLKRQILLGFTRKSLPGIKPLKRPAGWMRLDLLILPIINL